MNFDFIRYKARVLQTTAFNVLLFSVDISIQSQMQIKTFKAGSKPFVVVWASNFDIDAVARALTAKHIATEIVGQSAIDIIAVALTALHLTTTMNAVSEIEVMGRVCGAVAVTVENIDALITILVAMGRMCGSVAVTVENIDALITILVAMGRMCGSVAVTVENIEALITILVAMKTQASITASVDFSDTVGLIATLRACGYTEVEVQLMASMLATLTVIVSPDGAVVILAPGEYELTAVADVALDDSKAIIADAESTGIVSITVNLITLALLTDYDADTLSSLDTLSLEALAYIEIN